MRAVQWDGLPDPPRGRAGLACALLEVPGDRAHSAALRPLPRHGPHWAHRRVGRIYLRLLGSCYAVRKRFRLWLHVAQGRLCPVEFAVA